MNLQEIKKEAREEFEERGLFCCAGCVTDDETLALGQSFLEETIDRVVNEIEKAVVPVESETWQRSKGFNECLLKVKEAFTRFKGESV